MRKNEQIKPKEAVVRGTAKFIKRYTKALKNLAKK